MYLYSDEFNLLQAKAFPKQENILNLDFSIECIQGVPKFAGFDAL